MKFGILFSSAGRRGQLVECFRDSARQLGIDANVVAADMRPELSAACQLADRAFRVPGCREAAFVPELLRICEREGIRLLIPTIDTELAVLSKHCADFAAVGVDVAISAPEIVGIAGDKARTASVLQQGGIRCPRTLPAAAYATNPRQLGWPVILKPRAGSSSIGIRRPQTLEEAAATAADDGDLVVQELWQGREYTVNVFFDRGGSLRCAVPHLRIETRGGEVSKGRTEDVPVLREAAKTLARLLPGARGALCFQAILSADGQYAVFEINARFGGGYPIAHHAGATFSQWLLEESAGRASTAADTWRPNVTMLRYDAAVFHES